MAAFCVKSKNYTEFFYFYKHSQPKKKQTLEETCFNFLIAWIAMMGFVRKFV